MRDLGQKTAYSLDEAAQVAEALDNRSIGYETVTQHLSSIQFTDHIDAEILNCSSYARVDI